ncbi:MAG: hypothetical protein WC850_01890 [Candidatus Gracilibacteria bacterium]
MNIKDLENAISKYEYDLKSAELKEDYMLCTHILKDILKLLKDNNEKGIYKEKINSYKRKFRGINKKSLDNFKDISFNTDVSNDEIEKFFNFFINENDFNKLLLKITNHFIVKNDEVIKQSNEQSPVFLHLCSLDVYDDEGNILRGGFDSEKFYYYHTYHLFQGLSDLNLSLIFEKLISTDIINFNKLINYFKDKINIFPTYQSYYKFSHGLKKFFEGDFISSIHILVPLLEEVIIHISSMMNIDIIKLNNGKKISTNTKTLSSEIINNEVFMNKWGKDFSIQLDNVFFNEMGYKIRHLVAHGEIGYFECDFRKNILIIYFFISISNRVKITYNN